MNFRWKIRRLMIETRFAINTDMMATVALGQPKRLLPLFATIVNNIHLDKTGVT